MSSCDNGSDRLAAKVRTPKHTPTPLNALSKNALGNTRQLDNGRRPFTHITNGFSRRFALEVLVLVLLMVVSLLVLLVVAKMGVSAPCSRTLPPALIELGPVVVDMLQCLTVTYAALHGLVCTAAPGMGHRLLWGGFIRCDQGVCQLGAAPVIWSCRISVEPLGPLDEVHSHE